MHKIALLIVALSFFLQAKSSVWKISNAQNMHIYLGGTIHLLRDSDYPLPKAYTHAYQKSDIVVFETNIKDKSIGEYMAQKSLYPKGTQLKDKLSPSTYQALEKYCTKVGFPLALISRMRVSLAMLSLSLHKFQSLGFHAHNGVDLHFYDQASSDHKPIYSFETPQEQVDMILSIGEGQEDKMVEYTLKDLAQLEAYFDPIVRGWRVGDREILAASLLKELKAYPKIYKRLLVDRNHNWIVTINNYFKTDKIEFVLVGAGHLVGKDGLLQYFEQNGYRIEQVK